MIRKFAGIKNNQVVALIDIPEEEYRQSSGNYELLVDVQDAVPMPEVGWFLVGNQIIKINPDGKSQEDLEREKNKWKREFGTALSGEMMDRLGARNVILKKSGAFVTGMLINLGPISSLLNSGAIQTAYAATQSARAAYTEYQDILDLALDRMDSFLRLIGDR